MRIPPLTYFGTCCHCKKTVELKENPRFKTIGALPYHRHKGRRCKNTGYSADNIHPVILNDAEMDAVATFIANDNGKCFVYASHTMACGDGWDCVKVRTKLARALAVYHLEKIKLKQAA
jgi:hypothetical protein